MRTNDIEEHGNDLIRNGARRKKEKGTRREAGPLSEQSVRTGLGTQNAHFTPRRRIRGERMDVIARYVALDCVFQPMVV
jgi:hypothetical protein